jgi:hypothetical protein
MTDGKDEHQKVCIKQISISDIWGKIGKMFPINPLIQNTQSLKHYPTPFDLLQQ